ncbi:MAG: HAD family hydrolase [Clostridia bacterium]|nr:HAD family hydrolase [Clostridia bacterium]
MRPKLLIWDFNGTILDDAELCFAIENEMLLERGMKPITRDWYLDHFSFPIRDYYLQMGYTFETESYERVSEIFMERYNARYTGCPLREGVTEALAAFREAGMLQTLLSVTQQDDLERQAKKLGVAPYFSEMLGQTDIMGHSKVARAKEYMWRMRLDPEEALFIGDTDHDAEAAEAVGCPCVLLLGGHQSERVLSRCGVPIYASAKALQDALLKK